MMIRMKADYYYGLNSGGTPLKEEVILEGCENETLRKDLQNKVRTGEIGRDEYDRLRKKHLRRPRTTHGVVKMTLYLHHGDIVVMDGVFLQKYYEVCSLISSSIG